jgi:hypothetical protein
MPDDGVDAPDGMIGYVYTSLLAWVVRRQRRLLRARLLTAFSFACLLFTSPCLRISQDDGPLEYGKRLYDFFDQENINATHFYIGYAHSLLLSPDRSRTSCSPPSPFMPIAETFSTTRTSSSKRKRCLANTLLFIRKPRFYFPSVSKAPAA